MSFKHYLIVGISALFVGSCGTAPHFPQGRICTLVWNGTVEKSYAYCPMLGNSSNAIRVSAEELFREKYTAIDLDYYIEIMQWKKRIIKWGEVHCK